MPRRRLTKEELREQFAAAFNRRDPTEQEMSFAKILNGLPISKGNEWRIVPAVSGLMVLLTHPPKGDPPAFRLTGREQAERQIARLGRLAKNLDLEGAQREMDSLNGPAIDALAAPYVKLSRGDRAKATRTKGRRLFGFRNKDGGRIFEPLRMRAGTATERFSASCGSV
jgi:hypothetical protein